MILRALVVEGMVHVGILCALVVEGMDVITPGISVLVECNWSEKPESIISDRQDNMI